MFAPYSTIFREGLFAGQLCVVTGGGSGIGRCTAHELAALSARVVLIGRKLANLEGVREEISAAGGQAEAIALDIRDEEAVRAAVERIVVSHGRIHALVNNAGGQFPSPLAAISKRGFEAVVATNLTGGFLMAREVFTRSMSSHGGAIVNIVADMWNGMPGMGHSGAARAGMVNLTKTAAFEWAPFRVRVNAVAPGYIATSGLDRYEGPTRELIGKLRDHIPARRLGTEAEVSAAICFLLSPAAAFISGVTLSIDGGAPLGSALFPLGDHAPMPAFDGFHLSKPPAIPSGEAEER
jgi:citronellol/citronellal dehydrogenase